MRQSSINRRLTATVLLLELSAAVLLIVALAVAERHVQFKAFDAALEGTANSLLGSVQDADDAADNVVLDLRGISLDRDALFRVEDGHKVLGASAGMPAISPPADTGGAQFQRVKVHGRGYRFIVLRGLRIVDPGDPHGGVRHSITVIYGRPIDHVWHEIFEVIRFFAIATGLLLCLTALTMAALVRQALQPLVQLAEKAASISSADWQFEAPDRVKQTKELRPLADALEAALARLHKSFEQQRRFTSDAAHELKTDVAIVKSSLQLLSMRPRTAEEYRSGLDLSIEDFHRLEMTVQKMLTLARLEQPQEAANHSCLLNELIEEAVHQSSAFANLNAVTIDFVGAAQIEIPVDRRDALLLMSNILLNGLQHTPPQSTVQIDIAFEGGRAIVAIRDQGPGIAEEDLVHIFEPFYRGDPSRSRKSGSTGLGLAISKAICERAGGSISLTNQPSGGVLVVIQLPGKLLPASDPDIAA